MEILYEGLRFALNWEKFSKLVLVPMPKVIVGKSIKLTFASANCCSVALSIKDI